MYLNVFHMPSSKWFVYPFRRESNLEPIKFFPLIELIQLLPINFHCEIINTSPFLPLVTDEYVANERCNCVVLDDRLAPNLNVQEKYSNFRMTMNSYP